MNDGISLTQPPHLVAQRSSRRGLPLKLESETDLTGGVTQYEVWSRFAG